MKAIIAQNMKEMVEEIFTNLAAGGLVNISQNCKEIQQITQRGVLKMLSGIIEEVDRSFQASAERKETGLTIQQKNVERTVALSIGDLTYKRTVFYSKEADSYVYPTDEILGVGSRERISKELSARLIEEASRHSYGESSRIISDNRISRQSVKNKIQEVGELAMESSGAHKQVEHLDIYADEDHVHMQGEGSKIVPIVVVSEGKKGEKRKQLQSRLIFQGYNIRSDEFWEEISAFLREEYDLERSRIVIHGDGGQWIKGASEKFCNPDFVMDEFHIQKHMKKLCVGSIGQKNRLALHTCILSDNQAGFKEIIGKMLQETKETGNNAEYIKKAKERIQEEKKYFLNNWEAIVRRKTGNETGSCTESMVSHILSERLSRSPMGWSKNGLSKMCMLRVYIKNGGRVTAEDIGKGRINEFKRDSKGRRRRVQAPAATQIALYKGYAQKQLAVIFNGKYDWSIFDQELFRNGKVTGTSTILKACSKMRTAI